MAWRGSRVRASYAPPFVPFGHLQLLCKFKNEELKLFDFKKVIDRFPQFKAFEDDNLFYQARVDLGGIVCKF